ncbi:MAG: hypothetical protein AAB664_00885, partial [Patescibacteria group bacterium]
MRFLFLPRLLIIFLIGYGLLNLVPIFSFEKIPTIANPLYGLILFIFLSGFLINEAMRRNKTLYVSVALELSRTRRMAHIVENMNAHASWKKTVREAVILYLQSNDF